MIDWNQVKQLCSDVGSDEFGEIVELFLEEVETVVLKLRDNLVPAELEKDLHFVKGCALNLGFLSFSQLCHEGESMVGQGDAQNVNVAGIIDCFFLSKTTFLNEVEAQLAA